MANSALIRCPVCLSSHQFGPDTAPNKSIYCGNCRRPFLYRDGLPLNSSSPTLAQSVADGSAVIPSAEPTADVAPDITVSNVRPARNPIIGWILMIVALLIIFTVIRPYMQTIRGPDFLGFYFMYFMAMVFALWLFRKLWSDSGYTTIAFLLLYEVVGIIRYIDGSAAGMKRFSFMFMMMGIGAVFYVLRSDHLSGKGSRGSCSSCSSSSSSCSSGCGSSCGGCGGCGG